MSLDREKLVKVLARLSSSSDGEVVAAARAAVGLLTRSGETWYSLLIRRTSSHGVSPAAGPDAPGFMRSSHAMSHRACFRFVEEADEHGCVEEAELDEVERLRRKWKKSDYLSPADRDRLHEIVSTVKERQT